jgi:hypothetical protein
MHVPSLGAILLLCIVAVFVALSARLLVQIGKTLRAVNVYLEVRTAHEQLKMEALADSRTTTDKGPTP